MTTTSGSPRPIRRRGRLRWRVAAGALVAAGLGVTTVSASSAAPAAPKSTTLKVATARTVSSVRPATAPNCPTSTYPSSPTSKTGYGVAFTADLLDANINAGYIETPNPSTPGYIYAPWGLHVGPISGTVCGLIQIPSLNLSATPSDIQVATYGAMTGPGSIAAGTTADFSFEGLGDPGANEVAFNVGAFFGAGNLSSSTDSVAYYHTGSSQKLSVSNIVIDKAGVNKPAATPPGPSIQGAPEAYTGSVKLTNNSGVTVTNIQGEEPSGFVEAPTTGPGSNGTLLAGQSATFTYGVVAGLPQAQNMALNFRGETPSGPVTGFALVYYTASGEPGSSGPHMTIGNIEINGTPASSAPGPAVSVGSVFTTTFTVTNDSADTITTCVLINMPCPGPDSVSGSDQFPSVLALLGVPGAGGIYARPEGLHGFALSVEIPCAPGTSGADCPADLVTSPDGICGATDLDPPNYCQPANALSARGVAATSAVFTVVNPAINCNQAVSVNVTTGRSTVVPQQVTGADRNLPVWTMAGQGLVGPLVGAEGVVVANDFGLTVTDKANAQDPTPACIPWDGLFDLIAGGVTPPHSAACAARGESICYYNGDTPAGVIASPTSCLNQPNPNIFCGPPGEVQLSAEVIVSSIDLPNYNPSPESGVRRG